MTSSLLALGAALSPCAIVRLARSRGVCQGWQVAGLGQGEGEDWRIGGVIRPAVLVTMAL